MTQSQTNELIRSTAKRLFSEHGYEGLSMRILSKESGVGLSSIYHFFADKDVLLKAIYEQTNRELGAARRQLKDRPTAQRLLAERIGFQFDHIGDVIYVLKYYMHYRHDFSLLPTKTLPPKSALHIEEVLYKGLSTGEFSFTAAELPQLAKMIAHMINGYLLEYYPQVPHGAERKQLIEEMTAFSMRALTSRQPEGSPM